MYLCMHRYTHTEYTVYIRYNKCKICCNKKYLSIDRTAVLTVHGSVWWNTPHTLRCSSPPQVTLFHTPYFQLLPSLAHSTSWRYLSNFYSLLQPFGSEPCSDPGGPESVCNLHLDADLFRKLGLKLQVFVGIFLFSVFCFLFFSCFSGPLPWHMEVPRLGV